MAVKQLLNPAFTRKYRRMIRLFNVQSTYNLDDLGDNYSEKDADNTDNAPTYVRWDRHLLCGGEIS